MLRINAFFQVNEGAKEQFLAAAQPLVAGSQKEAGCIAYDLFASTTRPDVYLMCETWADAEALRIHEETEHFVAAFPVLEATSTIKIEKFEM